MKLAGKTALVTDALVAAALRRHGARVEVADDLDQALAGADKLFGGLDIVFTDAKTDVRPALRHLRDNGTVIISGRCPTRIAAELLEPRRLRVNQVIGDGPAEDLAATVVYLASDEAFTVQGAEISAGGHPRGGAQGPQGPRVGEADGAGRAFDGGPAGDEMLGALQPQRLLVAKRRQAGGVPEAPRDGSLAAAELAAQLGQAQRLGVPLVDHVLEPVHQVA